MKQIVAYYRVSTQQQGRSGLGIEAQRYAVTNFAAVEGFEIVAEYTEVETGKGADALAQRPQLAAALDHCKRIGATLVVAKLDRLTRDVHFGSGLLAGRQKFRVAEMPHADNFQLHIMLAVAEKEREMISQRTRDALAAAKARGVKLGGADRSKACADRAVAFAETLRDVVLPILQLSSRQIAARLNELGHRTANGGQWQSAQVIRLINRIKEEANVAEAA